MYIILEGVGLGAAKNMGVKWLFLEKKIVGGTLVWGFGGSLGQNLNLANFRHQTHILSPVKSLNWQSSINSLWLIEKKNGLDSYGSN